MTDTEWLQDVPEMLRPTGSTTAVFHRDCDGEVRLEAGATMPRLLSITEEVFIAPPDQWLTRVGTVVDIHVINGRWLYDVIGRCSAYGEVYCALRAPDKQPPALRVL